MESCTICLGDIGGDGAVFKSRPASCVCSFTTHQACFDTWLTNNDVAYKCLICRVEVRAYKHNIYEYVLLLIECYALYLYLMKGSTLTPGLGIFNTFMYLVVAYAVLEKAWRIVVRCQRLRG
jgi:hypothetical protein